VSVTDLVRAWLDPTVGEVSAIEKCT